MHWDFFCTKHLASTCCRMTKNEFDSGSGNEKKYSSKIVCTFAMDSIHCNHCFSQQPQVLDTNLHAYLHKAQSVRSFSIQTKRYTHRETLHTPQKKKFFCMKGFPFYHSFCWIVTKKNNKKRKKKRIEFTWKHASLENLRMNCTNTSLT